jgi:hypothetical protein
LGVSKENAWEKRSKTQQDKFNKQVNDEAVRFIASRFLEMLKNDFGRLGIEGLSAELDQADPFVVNVDYPKSFLHSYIRPVVRLEIGPLASWVPHDTYTICPYAAEEFPQVFGDAGCQVEAIKAQRAFWEKATILHQEAHRAAYKAPPFRYSRHYYDVYKMAHHTVKDASLASLDILDDVVAFKQRFYPCNWANYGKAKPGTLRLLPVKASLAKLEEDYAGMKEMMFGIAPGFDEMICTLEGLEREINALAS